MRTSKLTLAGLMIMAVALGGRAVGGIRSSHHDFSGATWAENQICLPCHTPHHADTTVADSPLWNHKLTTAAFTPYSTPTIDATLGQPGSITKLCLSCHDGTVAIDSYGSVTGTRTIHPYGNQGTDLRKHHPVSFVYDSSLAAADGELHDPSSAASGLGGTIAQDLLFQGRLECSSCHDVHVSRNSSGCVGCHTMHSGDIVNRPNTLSLRKSNAASALCLTCHKK